jgi:uncharacterized membrane protein
VRTLYNQIANQNRERLAALSDGVFAVAMTLLVLDLRLPPLEAIHSAHELAHGLLTLGPKLLMYFMSFLTLGIFWNGQQTQLNQFERVDRDLSWIHLAFLATITLMPFSTQFLAEFIAYRMALLVYWLNIFLPGALLFISWSYALRHDLVREDTRDGVRSAICRRVVIAQSLYAGGTLLCFIGTRWSIAAILLVQLNYALAPQLPWIKEKRSVR